VDPPPVDDGKLTPVNEVAIGMSLCLKGKDMEGLLEPVPAIWVLANNDWVFAFPIVCPTKVIPKDKAPLG